MTLCGLTVDAGAKSGIAEVDDACLAYLAERGMPHAQRLCSDADAHYALTLDIDLATLAPRVSIPPSPSHVRRAESLQDITIQHAYIGSCVSGSIEDLRAAAGLLKGRRVHADVQLLVIPATRRVFTQALAEGLLDTPEARLPSTASMRSA